MLYQISHKLFKDVHNLNIVILIEVLININDKGNTHGYLLQLEEAIEDYSEAIELDNEYDYAYNNRGIFLILCIITGGALANLGRKEEAMQDFTRALEINPQCYEAYCNRG